VMDNWSDRRRTNPVTPQVHGETVARMGILRADFHQGWSTSAHTQAGYRRAVRPWLTIASYTLAPPGASI
jgi:hypothetical protein